MTNSFRDGAALSNRGDIMIISALIVHYTPGWDRIRAESIETVS